VQRTVANRGGNTRGQYSFAQVPSVGLQRSVFNRSCGLKTGFDAADLVPIFADEALPGDTFKMRMQMFCRMQRPVVPLMDNIFMDVFFFAVPMRLLWDNWERFNGAQDDPGDSTVFLCPRFTAHTPAEGSLSDYLGVPIDTANDIVFNSFWHRAYNLIWNEWFRDENLQDSVVVDRGDGPDDIANYVVLKRGKRHDYFTSCLPWTQKGDQVLLPLGSTAEVVSAGTGIPTFDFDDVTNSALEVNTAGPGDVLAETQPSNAGEKLEWNTTSLEADLSTATAAAINEIRQAFQVQRLLERDARGGTRYTEILRSHFGVISADQRLQRPEFLGGGSCRVQIAPVPSTDAYGTANPGELGAYAVALTNQPSFFKSFTEHCVILGLVNARADLTYQQGLPRMFSRQTRWDFYWPAFAHLGEQAVLNQEIYCDGSAADAEAFGYQERYAEYRYKPSIVTGPLRSTAAVPLDVWHLGLEFGSLPLLNDVFIEDNPPISRVVVVPSEKEFFMDAWFEFQCARAMPTFSVPGLVDHF